MANDILQFIMIPKLIFYLRMRYLKKPLFLEAFTFLAFNHNFKDINSYNKPSGPLFFHIII